MASGGIYPGLYHVASIVPDRDSAKGRTCMGHRSYQQLREDLWEHKYKSALGEADNVLSFSQPETRDDGASALELVQQAAERLLLAGKQKDAAERARMETINALNSKLVDVANALKQ